MPFISGYGNIPITAVVPSGAGLTLDATVGDESYVYSGTNEVGGLAYSYDPGTAIELFDSGGVSMGFIEISDLPVDFSITSIITTLASGLSFAFAVPLVSVLFSRPNDALVSASFPTWDGLPLTWDSSFTDELLVPFTMDYSITGIGVLTTARYPVEINAVNFQTVNFLPTNQFAFEFVGTFEEGTPPTGPVTNPTINTTTPSVTVIPPPNTTIITVTTPTTTITTAATPGTPVTVVLPPSTPVVTIVPGPPGGSPPPVIIPIDLDVEAEGLVIDMVVASDIMLIGNPSGIYTLIPNQRFDVLYERAAGTTTTQTVQIPRPYGITSYVPENA